MILALSDTAWGWLILACIVGVPALVVVVWKAVTRPSGID
jgi:hypothetical protein